MKTGRRDGGPSSRRGEDGARGNAVGPRLAVWERRFEAWIRRRRRRADVAHDLLHTRRVVATAKRLAAAEGARLEVVVPAAWLHDWETVAKGSALRSAASSRSAAAVARRLSAAGYPAEWIPAVAHAIEAHSFSAGIEPRTVEARVVQDADRLDALGAVGLARCLMVGGFERRTLYHPTEPFPTRRSADDRKWTVDHFFSKLLLLAGRMRTATGRAEAIERTDDLIRFLDRLSAEIGGAKPPRLPGSGGRRSTSTRRRRRRPARGENERFADR